MLKGCKFKLLPTTVAVSSALFTQIAVADSEGEHEKMVVMGNPLQATEVFIDSEQLERQQANDINDIFRTDPEVSIGGGSGVSQKIYVRGIEDTKLNVSIDGATQSANLFHHQGRLSIEPELLKQVEVAAGAGRATDGPGALGGAIRFKTKDAEDMLQDGERFGGLVKAGYYDNTEGYKTSVSGYGYLTDSVSVLATLLYSNLGNYTDGAGKEQQYSEAQNKVGFLKVTGDLTNEQKVTLSYDRREDEAYRKFKPQFDDDMRGTAPLDQNIVRETITANYSYNPLNSNWLDLNFTVYNTDTSFEQLSRATPADTDNSIKYETIGGDIRNTSAFGQNSITYGVDYRHDSVNAMFAGVWKGKPYSDKYKPKGSVTGAYIQGDFQVFEPLLLSVGGRYDEYKYTDSGGFKLKHSGFSPNASLRYAILPSFSIYAGYAEALRGAQVPTGVFKLNNKPTDPDLKAERAKNTELGASWISGGFNLSATAYIAKIDDVVGLKNSNIGDLEDRGFTARAGYHWQGLSTSLSYNHSSPEIDGERLRDGDHYGIGTSTGDTWVADINYQVLDNLLIGYTGRYVQKLDGATVPDGGELYTYEEKPGFAVHDIYSQWKPLSGEELTLSLAVKNLFDKSYRDHASYGVIEGSDGWVMKGTREPGRDIRFNVAYAF
ncbi:TonB-dependent receptor domain-containing protein [Photobacterium angustum]|uniref:TonB-dependent receptor domain-containing protein n=1 Tax=Photobacterium angustum TaxID=661 RepID=UPI0005E6BD48|nr:TonB-dependent receptor [Photobacterium angustum]KJG02390.1 ligand-gated channel [Photobacterium angustum]PSV67932.1 TonB-dependent receptor [Photobacterium angustum]